MRQRTGALLAALAIGVGLGALGGAGPAAAGAWAVTVIDPLPSTIEAGTAYEVSFWVLQHGTHPYAWKKPASIGPVGLTLADEHGTRVSFPGFALAEPAHYTATVTVARDGRWHVTGVQGIFGEYHVGTLTVPGTLEALGVPAAPSPGDMQKYWPGRVRPPVLPVDHNRDPYAPAPVFADEPANGVPVPAAPLAGPDLAAVSKRGVRIPALVVVIAGAALVLSFAAARPRRWIRRAIRRAPAPRA